MKKFIALFFIYIFSPGIYSQFSEEMTDMLTAYGIHKAIDSDNYTVKTKAKEIMTLYPDDYVKQFCSVFDLMFTKWNYQKDPGGLENFRNAGETIETMTGDCDDYAILMTSMLIGLGGDGRVVCVSGHAYPELYLGKDLTDDKLGYLQNELDNYYADKRKWKIKTLNYHKDSDGSFWLNMDYQQPYPGGAFYEYSTSAEHLVIYPGGHYLRVYLNKY